MLKMTPEEAYNKVLDSGKRLPELELIIQQNAGWSCCYAAYIIKGRWSEAEPIIAQHAEYAYWYAKNILQGRWFEAEPVIAQSDYESDYISIFFSEPVITKDQCSDFEWERTGAVGYFAPRRLFERKESLIDMMIGNQNMSQC